MADRTIYEVFEEGSGVHGTFCATWGEAQEQFASDVRMGGEPTIRAVHYHQTRKGVAALLNSILEA